MELRHLRYFVVVAEEQSVTRAAARLHVSQPPLSRQVRDLEEELGVELFRRTAKSLALTEAGKIFLVEARAVLLRVDEAVDAVRAVAARNRGMLHVAYAPSLTVRLLPGALRIFESAHPGVRVSLHDLSSAESVQRLASGKIDLALTVRPFASCMKNLRGLTFAPLATYPIRCAVAVSHPLARKKSVALAELKTERFIVYSRDEYPEYYHELKTLFHPFGFEPRVGEEYEAVTGLIAAVEAGQGIALVSASLVCLTGPRLKLLPLKPHVAPISVGALLMKDASPLAQGFVTAAREAAKAEKALL
jgi:DNA-binding transcriptional LysR family regulator